jgi:DNA-binding transcriptional LysR family regulator
MKALIVYGGWDGHDPKACAELFAETLQARGVEVTEAGYLVHRRVQRILAESDKIAAAFEDRGDLRSGSVVVGMIPTVAPFLLPRLMEDFRRRHSGIQVRVTEARTEDLIDKVVAEEVDFAVLSDVDPVELK